MRLIPAFEYTDAAKASGLALPLGILAASGVSMPDLQYEVDVQKKQAFDLIRAGDIHAARSRMACFSDHFADRGYSCPLPQQLRSISKKGFPAISPCIDALLVCEMTSGLLMGVQDLDSIEGHIVYDIARQGESFQSLRDSVSCRSNEIVLRDSRSIIASYFQGPNRRINVTPNTKSLLFFVFGAPKLETVAIEEGVRMVADLIAHSIREIETNIFDAQFAADTT
jgi:DNA/RNA-binding domain of Phe-tRNA-synthetase-like protein